MNRSPSDLFSRLPDPRARLSALLHTWTNMNEGTSPEANVRDLYVDIMEIFRDHPEAEAWFGDWRATHSAERLV